MFPKSQFALPDESSRSFVLYFLNHFMFEYCLGNSYARPLPNECRAGSTRARQCKCVYVVCLRSAGSHIPFFLLFIRQFSKRSCCAIANHDVMCICYAVHCGRSPNKPKGTEIKSYTHQHRHTTPQHHTLFEIVSYSVVKYTIL